MNTRWKSALLVTLIAATMTMQPLVTAAQVGGDDAAAQSVDWNKFWDYGLCAASIAFASGTGGWVLAFFVCGKVAKEHWIH